MKFCLLFLGLAASSVFAELGQVLLCTGANQTGTCDLVKAQIPTTGSEGKCFNLADTAFGGKNGTLGTFAPDGEQFGCYARYIPCGGICRAASGCSITQKPITFDYAYKYSVPAGVESFGCFLLHPSQGGSEPTTTTEGAKPSNTCACAPVSSNTCACGDSKNDDKKIEKRGKKGQKVKKPKTKTAATATATARMDLWTDERDGD